MREARERARGGPRKAGRCGTNERLRATGGETARRREDPSTGPRAGEAGLPETAGRCRKSLPTRATGIPPRARGRRRARRFPRSTRRRTPPRKRAKGMPPAASARARRGAGITAQRAITAAGSAAGYSERTARPSSAPASASPRNARDGSPGRKSTAHAPNRHAATRACEKRSRPYVKSGVAKRSAKAALADREGEAPNRTATRKRTSARRIAGSVAPTSRIAHRTGRIEEGEGAPTNGRARRYPGSATSAAPGALFE